MSGPNDAFPREIRVSFGPEFRQEPVSAILVSEGTWKCICPPAKAAALDGTGGVGRKASQVLRATDLAVLANFTFTYVARPAVLMPSFVPITGGNIKVQVSFPPPGVNLNGCSFTFGGTKSLNTTLLSSAGAPTPITAEFAVRTGALSSAADAPGALVCPGAQPQLLGTTLRYVNAPSVSPDIFESGSCTTIDCTLLITILHPPPWITGLDGLIVTVDEAQSSTRRSDAGNAPIVTLLSMNPAVLMSIRIELPPAVPFSEVSIVPASAPGDLDPNAFTVHFNFTMAVPIPTLKSISSRMSSILGGDPVTVEVRGMLPSNDPNDFAIAIDNISVVSPQILYSDGTETGLRFTVPARPSGRAGVATLTVSRATVMVSTSFGYMDMSKVARCTQTCSVRRSGGVSSTFELTGLSGISSPAQVQVSVGAEPAVVQSVSVGPNKGIVVRVLMPAMPGATPTETLLVLFQTAPADLLATVDYVGAPEVLSARFNSVGSRVEIAFNVATNGLGRLPCSDVVTNTSSLGSSHSCVWTDSRTLSMVLGVGAQLMPGDTLTLTGANFSVRTMDGASDATGPVVVEVRTPKVPAAPDVRLNGPSVIGSCDTANLVAEAPAARPLTYVWGCVNDPRLNLLLADFSQRSIQVPGTSLSSGKEYQIWVQAESFLGGLSQKVYVTLTSVSLPPPIVSMILPAAPVYSSSELFFSSSAVLSACALTTSALTFRWSIGTELPVTPANTLVTITGTSFSVPPGTLAPGHTYGVRLVVLQDGTTPGSLDNTLYVQKANLVARIAGGSKLVSRTTPALLLDASESRDPDTCPVPPCAPDPAMQFR
jgi:hypothetical protein